MTPPNMTVTGGIFFFFLHVIMLLQPESQVLFNSRTPLLNALCDSIMYNSILSSCKVKFKQNCNKIGVLSISPHSHSCHPILCQFPPHLLHHLLPYLWPMIPHCSLVSDTKKILLILYQHTSLFTGPQSPYSIPLFQPTYPFEKPFPLASILQMLPILKLEKPISSMKPSSPATLTYNNLIFF